MSKKATPKAAPAPRQRTQPMDWAASPKNLDKRAAQGLPAEGGPRVRKPKPDASAPVAEPPADGDAAAE